MMMPPMIYPGNPLLSTPRMVWQPHPLCLPECSLPTLMALTTGMVEAHLKSHLNLELTDIVHRHLDQQGLKRARDLSSWISTETKKMARRRQIRNEGASRWTRPNPVPNLRVLLQRLSGRLLQHLHRHEHLNRTRPRCLLPVRLLRM